MKRLLVAAAALALLFTAAALGYRTLSARVEAPGVLQAAASSQESAPDASRPAQEEPASGQEPAAAPDFTVYDGDGEAVRLSDFAGRPVLLNFWATWCGPCRSELAAFDAAWAEYGDRIDFLMIDLTDAARRETPETVAAFLAENGYRFPVYHDRDGEAAAVYGVRSIPTTVLVGPDGSVIAGQVGALEEETVQVAMELLLESAA